MADLRRCIGSTKFGIEAHDAPLEDFPAQPSQKDGLGRMCRPHWKAYVSALTAARKAGAGGYPAKAEAAPPSPRVSNQQRRAAAQAAGKVPAADGSVPGDEAPALVVVSGPETPAVTRRRRRLEAAVEAVGVGTDEGQRILESGEAG